MTVTLGHVVVICMAMLLLKKSFVLVIYGRPFSSIASLLFASAMNAKFTNARCTPHPLTYTPSLPLILFPNGTSTILHVTLVWSWGNVILSLLWIISPNGPKRCLCNLQTVKRQLNSFSIMLFLGSAYLKPFSQTMAPISEIT